MTETVDVLPAAVGLPTEASPDVLSRALELFDAGGPVMFVLLGCSIVGLAVILLKLGQFAVLRIGRRGFVEPVLGAVAAGRSGEALGRLTRERSPVARVMEAAIAGASARPGDDPLVREEVSRVAAAELESLRSHLRALEVVGSLSPLLGLFGTVLGMITAFQRLQDAGRNVDPAVLSGGIWEALLTTAAGLAVAIPAVVAHAWFERRIERVRHDMEDAATRVFTGAIDGTGGGPARAEARRATAESVAGHAL